MNILAIGNSFSQDATRYLHHIAAAQGENWLVANLYIGGCPLDRHFRNMLTERDAYELQWNGSPTGFYVSLKEALCSRSWDVVTLQQASHKSTHYDTYQPYLSQLAAYVRAHCPKAKLVIHQTWAYEADSQKLAIAGFDSPSAMFSAVEKAYNQAMADINADLLIPSGRLFEAMRAQGLPVHRDTYHASLGHGRYALGLLWYRRLSGNSVTGARFSQLDVAVPPQELHLLQQLVEDCN